MKPLISIVIPVYNEELNIEELCARLVKLTQKLQRLEYEIIMVENGSFDNSYELLIEQRNKNKKIKILQLAKNVGTDGALVAGLSFAKGDAAVVMMADLQDVPELIPEFIKKWNQGYDIVYGIVKKRVQMNWTRKLNTYLYYKLITLISRGVVIDNASDFRLIDKKVYSLIVRMPEHNKFFRGLVTWTGFKQIGIPFDRPPRFAGESKAYFTTAMTVALNGIFSFSSMPIYIPLFLSVLTFFISIILLILHQFSLSYISFLFTFVFLIFGILLEYQRRILNEVQNRPQFIVKDKKGL